MEKIIEILENLKPGIDFKNEKGLISNAILTSMEIVQLVMELNDAFDIEISPMDILPENFESIECINKLVEKYLDE
ncbi:MAG: phosphopantetheine-binding protein [Bacilli bacterium]|nr:phosphopantetheine-binding protein [Bacilli bacterium]